MFEDNVLELGERVREDFESPPSVPASHESGVTSGKQDVTARAPSPSESPVAKEAG
jgi:membrane fusion protein, multidrug efflux system